jgi:hypothetical protein
VRDEQNGVLAGRGGRHPGAFAGGAERPVRVPAPVTDGSAEIARAPRAVSEEWQRWDGAARRYARPMPLRSERGGSVASLETQVVPGDGRDAGGTPESRCSWGADELLNTGRNKVAQDAHRPPPQREGSACAGLPGQANRRRKRRGGGLRSGPAKRGSRHEVTVCSGRHAGPPHKTCSSQLGTSDRGSASPGWGSGKSRCRSAGVRPMPEHWSSANQTPRLDRHLTGATSVGLCA